MTDEEDDLPDLPVTIRPFPMGAILAGVEEAVSHIPEGHTVAVIAHADQDGGRFAVAARVDEHWSFMGYLEKPWDGRLEYGAGVVWSR